MRRAVLENPQKDDIYEAGPARERRPPIRKVREKPPPKNLWLVITECPIHRKEVHIVLEAEDAAEAKAKALDKTVVCPYPINHETHTFKIEKVSAVTEYPWKPREVITRPVEAPRPPVEKEAPTVLISSKRINGTIAVTIGQGRDRLSITFPKAEVQIYDQLMRIAKSADRATMENGILAFLITHSGGTKTMIAGFLQANGFPEATPSSVGEALSRLLSEGIIYRYPAIFKFTYYPLGIYGKKERKYVGEIMGETVYGISAATRMHILETLKFQPHLDWWRTVAYLATKRTLAVIKKPVEYEWVTTIRDVPGFRASEDFKYYGPYKKGVHVKLPITFAYFLVRAGYAEWLNPRKETVKKAEEVLKFKFKTTGELKRQATLFEFPQG